MAKSKIARFVKNPYRVFNLLANRGWLNWLSDRAYLKLLFRANVGRRLPLDAPLSFNEKLQWLKLYDRKPEYTAMVDKYEAKKYVAERIGEEYIIPTLGVWDRVEDIDFDSLPDRFVLKCTHDSGGLVICRDKASLDIEKVKQKLEKAMKNNFYYSYREWPYKDVKPRIIAEEYMDNGQSGGEITSAGLVDYKFYCFNGEPRFLYVSQGLEDHSSACISFLTLDWNFAPYERSDYKPFKELPRKPQQLDLMVEFARKLSAGTAFLRVDLYEINGQVYFSELTFFPCAGFMPFKNSEHDFEIGSMLELK